MTAATATLRQAAAVLLAEADRQEGKIANPQQMTTYAGRSVTVQECWELMLEEIAQRNKPHAWNDWAPGVLPEQVGDGTQPSPLYEGAKPFWQQMERQQPVVLDSTGQRFNAIAIVKRAGWDGFDAETRRLWDGPEGVAYRAAPENAAIWPRIRV